MTSREWYRDGLRFECTLCGHCCTGPPGYVLFSEEEGRKIAARLGISLDEFLHRYTHETSRGPSLNEIMTPHGADCVFLDRETQPGKAICSLYEDRPTQCRTFPFWPQHLRSAEAWEKLGDSCEGVGRGPVVRVEQIRIMRETQEQCDQRARRA